MLRSRGDRRGALAGVPFAVKNLIDVAGLPTLAGSKINQDHPPATADAPLVSRLEAAGAILVGTLNMGEYAYDFTGENVHYGPSRNPFDTKRMTGGSSGGSGGAVGGGLVPLALGSDTNGSIRVPASFCGLFGLKPTYGRLTRAGSFPFVSSLDHLGPLARSAGDLAVSYDAMQGYDAADPVCVDRPVEAVSGLLDRGIDGLRIASREDISALAQRPKPWWRWIPLRRRLAQRRRSRSRTRNGLAVRPTSSPPPKGRRCIWNGCEQGRMISMPMFEID